MKRYFLLFIGWAWFGAADAQTAYFIDGYHGGIYGHIPPWQTRFMVDRLRQYPDWSINLELEPESWDTIKIKDPAAYAEFRRMITDPDTSKRIEYINPAYAQAYMYNITGESIIRQFYYGMQKLRQHFPGLDFQTYSSEEPCFTSCLPGILRGFGFRYASLKNPNTCWGGYSRAFGGEWVNWVGPDGSVIPAVPRYAVEDLQPGSVWQTIATSNDVDYVRKAFADGIRHPVGMTLQDAGWSYGPWLRGKNVLPSKAGDRTYAPSVYSTWRAYFQKIAADSPSADWHFSQEDVLVSLMWGSQVLQRIARSVRSSENGILMSEKLAAMAGMAGGGSWPGELLDAGWRTLLLSQHHDCWIVPYNGKAGDTWADKVVRWTGNTDSISRVIRDQGLHVLSGSIAGGLSTGRLANLSEKLQGKHVMILNTTAAAREEWVRLQDGGWLKARVPALGYAVYPYPPSTAVKRGAAALVVKQSDGLYKIETDLYRILIDPTRGGVITSLVARQLGNKEFVDRKAAGGFNLLRGNFYRDGGFRSSADTAAVVKVLENGSARVKVAVFGFIDGSPFTQVLSLSMGSPRIDCHLRIDWRSNVGVGESAGPSSDKEVRKSYYDDRYKLLALFPLPFTAFTVYKNAPFDVMKSGLDNTFFNRWDSIKNNVLLNWVDVEDEKGAYGLALLSDHTTSYVHGEGYPLGLTLQYSGNGIFYRNYGIDRPTELDYALIPHAGRWDQAGIWTMADQWNEPLVVNTVEGDIKQEARWSMIDADVRGWEVSSMCMEGKDLLVRLFNAEGVNSGVLRMGFTADAVRMEELDGRVIRNLPVEKGRDDVPGVKVILPRYTVRTFRFINVKMKKDKI